MFNTLRFNKISFDKKNTKMAKPFQLQIVARKVGL